MACDVGGALKEANEKAKEEKKEETEELAMDLLDIEEVTNPYNPIPNQNWMALVDIGEFPFRVDALRPKPYDLTLSPPVYRSPLEWMLSYR